MYQRIVVPTDGSVGTAHVAMQAIELAEQFESVLHVVNVVETEGPLSGRDDAEEDLQAQGRRTVARIEGMATQNGVSVETAVLSGDPSEEIVDYAEEVAADLIVAGTHGRTGMQRRLIGSVAERLVRHAPCPVLTVRLPETDVTVQDEDEAREVAREGIEERGYRADVTGVEEENDMWVLEAETDGGSLAVYVDPVSQLTRVYELD